MCSRKRVEQYKSTHKIILGSLEFLLVVFFFFLVVCSYIQTSTSVMPFGWGWLHQDLPTPATPRLLDLLHCSGAAANDGRADVVLFRACPRP